MISDLNHPSIYIYGYIFGSISILGLKYEYKCRSDYML